MKIVYILLVLVIVASALGCVGKKPAESTSAPTPGSGLSDNGDSRSDSDLTQIDSMMNESTMDISLPEVNADAFT